MRVPTWLSFFIFLFPLAVLPLLFGEFVIHGLAKLHLRPDVALVLVFGMLAMGFVNIPIKRVAREAEVAHHPLTIVGLSDLLPQLERIRKDTIVAVNVGGCLIPTGLALYEIWHVYTLDPQLLLAAMEAIVVNAIVCYLIAQPVPRVGIAMPALVSPLVATGLAWLLAPDQAPPVAFAAGVLGPLIGADLLHLRDVEKLEACIISVGGAGTFDGIVLSGVVAAYLS